MNTHRRTLPHPFLIALLLLGAPLAAQEPAEPVGEAPAGEAPGGPDVDWVKGPAIGKLGGKARIDVPSGHVFAEAADTQKLLEAMGNPTSGSELGFVGPESLEWFVVFEFSDIGYVKDDDRDELDADALLASIREGTKAGNAERRKRGWSELEIVGWERPPHYDPATNNLEWAIRGRSPEGDVVNYNTRLLGRRGVMEAALVVDPAGLDAALPPFRQLLSGYTYIEGERYAEFSKGDKVAAVGLAALVTGGAAAVALKTGLLQKFWKFIVIAVIALGGLLKKLGAKLFGRRPIAPPSQGL